MAKKKSKPRFKPGDLLEIHFDDHCQSDGTVSEPLNCTLPCYFVEEKEDHYKVATWVTEGQLVGENTTTYTLLKNTNVRIKKLSRTRGWLY